MSGIISKCQFLKHWPGSAFTQVHYPSQWFSKCDSLTPRDPQDPFGEPEFKINFITMYHLPVSLCWHLCGWSTIKGRWTRWSFSTNQDRGSSAERNSSSWCSSLSCVCGLKMLVWIQKVHDEQKVIDFVMLTFETTFFQYFV